MSDAKEAIEQYFDEWQLAVIKANPASRSRVIAGPGTGKTTTLAAKVVWMVDAFELDPESIVVLSFTRKAVAGIRNKVSERVSEEIAREINANVRTFDSYCTMLLEGPMGEPKDRLKKMQYASRIERVIQGLIDDASPLAGLRHLIVDEYQDLVGVRADLVLQLIDSLPEECGVTLLGDPCQAIYNYQVKGSRERDYESFRLANERQPGFIEFELKKEYRTKGFARPDWLVDDLAALRRAILAGNVSAAGVAASIAAEDIAERSEKICTMPEVRRRGLEEVVGHEGGTRRRIGVIARTNREAQRVSQELLGAVQNKIHVELAKDEQYSGNDENATEDEDPGIYVFTVHASKGREFSEVWLCQETIDYLMRCCGLARLDQAEEARVAYVAFTRTKGGTLVLQHLTSGAHGTDDFD